jgi:hypothetical protein
VRQDAQEKSVFHFVRQDAQLFFTLLKLLRLKKCKKRGVFITTFSQKPPKSEKKCLGGPHILQQKCAKVGAP